MRVMGPFDIGEVLARGGAAVVHAAHRTGDAGAGIVAKVAVAGDELRLHHENSILREISHPAVIAPVAFVDDGSAAALILPRAACSLRAHAGRLTSAEAAHVALAVAEGLAATHRAGYVHGDVTAGNVLLRPDGSAMLADLGAATRWTEEGARTDVTMLASTATDSCRPDERGRFADLLREVMSHPISALDLAERIREVAPDARAPDPLAAPPVIDEPPTMTAN